MSTRRNKYDILESPYAKHLSEYPSQSGEFLPLEFGAPCEGELSRNFRNTSTPAKYGLKASPGRAINTQKNSACSANIYPSKQYNKRYSDNRYFNNGYNQISNGDNIAIDVVGDASGWNYQSHQRHSQKFSPYGRRKGGERFKCNEDDSMSFFHPSMLEDPWKELLERHNAIRESKINISTEKEQDNEQNAAASTSSSKLTKDSR